MHTIPKNMQAEKAENLRCFPALAIGLSEHEISRAVPGQKGGRLTDHQKAACRIAANRIGWHPVYVAGICPAKRPALLPKLGDQDWEARCQAWQHEHDISVDELAAEYEREFDRVGYRLYGPLDLHKDGVKMSAYDNNQYDYPYDMDQW